jgi:hypothetical protein
MLTSISPEFLSASKGLVKVPRDNSLVEMIT